jgi:hypothetical protein
MKAIKNMRELDLMKEKLEYQELFYEKELVGNSAEIIDNVTDKLKDAAVDFATRLLLQIILPSKKNQTGKDKDKKEK